MFALALYAGEGSEDGDGSRRLRQQRPDAHAIVPHVAATRLRDRRVPAAGRSCTCTPISISQAAVAYWSEVLDIPVDQFNKPYRAVVDPTIRRQSTREWLRVDRVLQLYIDPPACDGDDRGGNLIVRHSGIAQLAERGDC